MYKIHVACVCEGTGHFATFETPQAMWEMLVTHRYIKETETLKPTSLAYGDDEDVNEEVSDKLVAELTEWLNQTEGEGECLPSSLTFHLVNELLAVGHQDYYPENVDLVFMWG
jgi:hypothetical protein